MLVDIDEKTWSERLRFAFEEFCKRYGERREDGYWFPCPAHLEDGLHGVTVPFDFQLQGCFPCIHQECQGGMNPNGFYYHEVAKTFCNCERATDVLNWLQETFLEPSDIGYLDSEENLVLTEETLVRTWFNGLAESEITDSVIRGFMLEPLLSTNPTDLMLSFISLLQRLDRFFIKKPELIPKFIEEFRAQLERDGIGSKPDEPAWEVWETE